MRNEDRINTILEILLKYIQKDFSHTIPVSEKEDELDALSAGLNTMAEELRAFIEERKTYENQLRKSNELFSSLFEYNPAALAISRLSDSRIINVNKSFLTLFQYASKEEVLGKTSKELNLVADTSRRDEIMQVLEKNRRVFDVEGAVRTGTGQVRWVSSSLLVTEVDSQPCLMAVIQDITDRKKAEEEIRKINTELEQTVITRTREVINAELEYRALIEQATDGIFISDEKGKYVDANQSACRMLGYSKDELLQLSVWDILVPDEIQNNPPNFGALMAGETLLSTRNLRRKNGNKCKNAFKWSDVGYGT
jgi:PAS domain S-box-containing protein